MKLNILFIWFLLALAGITCGGFRAEAHVEDTDREYKLKAAFLLNFSKFTTWPKGAFAQSPKSFDF